MASQPVSAGLRLSRFAIRTDPRTCLSNPLETRVRVLSSPGGRGSCDSCRPHRPGGLQWGPRRSRAGDAHAAQSGSSDPGPTRFSVSSTRSTNQRERPDRKTTMPRRPSALARGVGGRGTTGSPHVVVYVAILTGGHKMDSLGLALPDPPDDPLVIARAVLVPHSSFPRDRPTPDPPTCEATHAPGEPHGRMRFAFKIWQRDNVDIVNRNSIQCLTAIDPPGGDASDRCQSGHRFNGRTCESWLALRSGRSPDAITGAGGTGVLGCREWDGDSIGLRRLERGSDIWRVTVAFGDRAPGVPSAAICPASAMMDVAMRVSIRTRPVANYVQA
jgi:hypothetical protein